MADPMLAVLAYLNAEKWPGSENGHRLNLLSLVAGDSPDLDAALAYVDDPAKWYPSDLRRADLRPLLKSALNPEPVPAPTVVKAFTMTVERTVFQVSLPTPANLTDLRQATELAHAKWEKSYGSDGYTDDTFTVRVEDHYIHIEWNGPESATGGIHF